MLVCSQVKLCRMILPQVRCWEVQDNGQTVPKAQQMHTGPVLDACWSDVSLSVQTLFHSSSKCGLLTPRIISLCSKLFNQDGSKVFTASCDKTAKMWDLNSNQAMQIAQVEC